MSLKSLLDSGKIKPVKVSGDRAHKNTFEFMRKSLGEECVDLISFFDRMRPKRNIAIYDTAGIITETEVKELFKKIERIRRDYQKKLRA